MAREKGSVTRAEMDGKAVWVKRYGSQSRQLRLAAMRRVVNRLGVPALLPPPHHVGDAARATEQRRLLQLRAAGVNVPPVVGSGPGVLILGDLGPTLATSLRSAHTGEAEALFSGAAWALASAQRRGGYIGQPQARNITIDAQRNFGFLDFEEDPGEVMLLDQAQTRDWLVFAAGAAHHLPFCDRRMGELIAPALEVTSDDVKEGLDASLGRLEFLPRVTRAFGSRAAGLGKAVMALRHGLGGGRGLRPMLWVVLVACLGMDFLHDGDLEAFSAVARWLD